MMETIFSVGGKTGIARNRRVREKKKRERERERKKSGVLPRPISLSSPSSAARI